MWSRTYSKVYPGVKKEAVWQLWADVKNWPAWDQGLEYCKITRPFELGTEFKLKPLGAPEVKIVISEVVPPERFIDYCDFFGARMYDAHYLEETPEGLRVTQIITVKGLLSFLWVQLVAKKIVKELPEQIDSLIAKAMQ